MKREMLTKRITGIVTVAVALTLLPSVGVPGAETPLVCAEDEILCLSDGDAEQMTYTHFYDCNGRLLGMESLPIRESTCYTIPKGSIFETEENGNWVIYTVTDAVHKLAEYPQEQYSLCMGDNCYYLRDEETGELIVYDQNCEEVGRVQSDTEYDSVFKKNEYYFLAASKWLEEKSLDEYIFQNTLLRIDGEGNVSEIYNEIGGDWAEIYCMGNSILFGETLLDMDGNILYEGVHRLEDCMNGYGWTDKSTEAISVIDPADAGRALILDAELNPVVEVSLSEYPEVYYMNRACYHDGFVENAPHEIFEGAVCKGFLPVGGPYASTISTADWEWIVDDFAPYTETAEGITVYYSANLYRIPLAEGESAIGINGKHYLVEIADESENHDYPGQQYQVRSLEDHSVEYEMSGISLGYMDLKEDSIFYWPLDKSEGVLYSFSEQSDLLSKNKITGKVKPWRDMYYVIRGPYRGLVNEEGTWLVRELSAEE